MSGTHFQIEAAGARSWLTIGMFALAAFFAGCCGTSPAKVEATDIRLEKVGTRLAQADLTGRALKLEIEESAEENAYCSEDGTIVIYEGMLKLCESEDELAAVIAHEMGHLIAKHKGSATPAKEMEADETGVRLMAMAGYDPSAAVRFWRRYYERINWWEGDGMHQEPRERVEMLKRLADNANRARKR